MSLKSAFLSGKNAARNHLEHCANTVSLEEKRQSLDDIRNFAGRLAKIGGQKLFVHNGTKSNGTQTVGHYINMAERTYPHRNIMIGTSNSGALQVEINQHSATTESLKGSVSCTKEQALEFMAAWIGAFMPESAQEIERAIDEFEASRDAQSADNDYVAAPV